MFSKLNYCFSGLDIRYMTSICLVVLYSLLFSGHAFGFFRYIRCVLKLKGGHSQVWLTSLVLMSTFMFLSNLLVILEISQIMNSSFQNSILFFDIFSIMNYSSIFVPLVYLRQSLIFKKLAKYFYKLLNRVTHSRNAFVHIVICLGVALMKIDYSFGRSEQIISICYCIVSLLSLGVSGITKFKLPTTVRTESNKTKYDEALADINTTLKASLISGFLGLLSTAVLFPFCSDGSFQSGVIISIPWKMHLMIPSIVHTPAKLSKAVERRPSHPIGEKEIQLSTPFLTQV